MLAEGVNGLFGHSALIIGLAASVFGAGALATATVASCNWEKLSARFK